MVGGGSRPRFPSLLLLGLLLGYHLGKPLLEPSLAHLQHGHRELVAVELAEATGDHLPGQLLLDPEVEQQFVIVAPGPLWRR